MESNSRGRGGARGGTRGGAPKAPAPSRFKPKNVRRDASELEEIARKENDRLAAIAAENAREASRQMRGRGRPLRGRGDAMGRGRGLRKTTATGFLGVAPESLKTAAGGVLTFKREGGGGEGVAGSNRSAGAVGGFNIKREGGGGSYSGPSGSGGAQNRDWHPEPIYPHEDDDVAKIDIEAINLITDDEDDEPQFLGSKIVKGKGKASSHKGLRPVRLMREEHKERVLLVNTEAAVKPPPESDDDMPTVVEARSTGRKVTDSGDVKIKDEPRTTPEPSSPEIKRSPDSRRNIQDSLIVPIHEDASPDASPSPESKKDTRVRAPIVRKIKQPVFQTEEDKAEWSRHLEDVSILTKELSDMQGSTSSKGNGKEVDGEGDAVMDDVATTADDEAHKWGNGRLYLFQFPPVLPELYNPKDPKPRSPILVKRQEEEAAAKAKEELEVLGSMKGKNKQTIKDRPDLTGEALPPIKIEIKKEDTDAIVETPAEKAKREQDERNRKNKKPEIVHEEGFVGKLIVRESGRVELIWGGDGKNEGTTLLVGRGAEASFLTTGVIVDSIERGPPGGGVPEGKAMGMGQIMGKFVVTPDWQNY